LQFSVTNLLVLTAGSALLFALFRLLGLSPRACLLITGLIACGVLAAGALVMSIAQSASESSQRGPEDD
jgi:hypothetical protein